MSATITSDFIKTTIEKPNKILNCEELGLTIYIKEIEGIGELLVVAKKENANQYDIKCFDWVKSMEFTFDS